MHFKYKDRNKPKVKGWEESLLTLIKRKSGYINNKANFVAKIITKDKRRYFIMTKGKIHEEYITVLHTYMLS